MNRSTLPRHARAHAPGWSHPYGVGPFSPVFYADGDGDEGQDDEGDGTTDDGDSDTTEGADGAEEESTEGDEPDPDGADELGDKGKRALDSMKAKLKAEREKRRAAEAKLTPEGDNSDAATIQAKADQAATAKANARILRSEIKAAATGKLINPKDALTFLDFDEFEVDEDGQVDEDEIADAIDGLLKERPYLAAATAKRFQGTGDGGAARKAGRPKQLTRADLKNMSAEAIDKAREDGRLDDLMGGK